MTEEQRGKDNQVDRPEDDSSWDEGRWSETDAPHEEQDAGTLHVPHEGEEGQAGDAA